MIEPGIQDNQLWMVVVGFIIAFILAFGIGANDVANTFGSSVGSGVLSLKQACILATICEFSGSLLLGSKVSSTVRKGIVEASYFNNTEDGATKLMAGQVAALSGSCVWLLLATFLRLPVSGTHSIVGATMGFSLVLFDHHAINWIGVGKIVASWFISPLISGAVSVVIFITIHYLVLVKDEPLEPALRLLPGFYGMMIAVNIFSILLGGAKALNLDKVPLYGIFILACGGGTITVILIKLIMLPHLRKRILAGEAMTPKCLQNMDEKCPSLTLPNCCKRSKKQKLKNSLTPKNSVIVNNVKTTSDMIADVAYNGSAELNKSNATEMSIRGTIEEPDEETALNGVLVGTACGDNANNGPDSGEIVPSRRRHRAFEVRPTELGASDLPATATRVGSHDSQAEHGVSVTRRTGVLAQPSLPAIGEEDVEMRPVIKDRPVEAKVFWLLQIMTSVLGSFAHGGNDVSNAIGPLMALWIIGRTQDVLSSKTNPYWILVYGGIGISVGLWVWGRRVIRTLGKDLTTITPSSGVSIELGSALTVLLASKLGLPVSTTHCQVGSVIFVGRFRSRDNVDWRLFRNIFLAWIVTVPATCGLSAGVMWMILKISAYANA